MQKNHKIKTFKFLVSKLNQKCLPMSKLSEFDICIQECRSEETAETPKIKIWDMQL